jgi:hypothetical protein
MPATAASAALLALAACTPPSAGAQGASGCACDHGTTALCCGQPGTPCPPNGPETCSPELPTCTDYVFGKHMGMCATRESGTALCDACVDGFEEGHHPTGDNLRDSHCASPEDACVGPVEVGSAAHKAACCALCAVTLTCDTWIISVSGPAECWVKKGGGAITENKDRGVGKVAEAYLTHGCPLPLASWGSPLVIVLALAAAGYVGGGSVLGSRAKGAAVAVRNHPHWPHWHELRGLCEDGMTYTRSGGKSKARQPLLSGHRDGEGERSGKSGREKAGKRKGSSSEKRQSGKSDTSQTHSSEPSPAPAEHSEGAAQQPRAGAAAGKPAGDGGRWVHVGAES